MIAGLLAVAALSQAPWEGYRIVELPVPWEHIEIGDWTYLGESTEQDVILLVQPGRQSGQVWVRYEYLPSDQRALSSRALLALDCEGWRTQTLQPIYYTENNMTGERASGLNGQWLYAAPGTFGESILEFGCGV